MKANYKKKIHKSELSLEEFIDNTINDISNDLKEAELQQMATQVSDSKRNFKICCELVDNRKYLDRMFECETDKVKARKYMESKLKGYAKVMFEETLDTIWENVENCLINDIEECKKSNKKEAKNDDELTFESQKACIKKISEMKDLTYLKDRLKIKIPAEIDTDKEREKAILFLLEKLHDFQGQQFEKYLSCADEKNLSVLLSHIWYYSNTHNEIVKKYAPEEETKFIEDVIYYTNNFANPLTAYKDVHDAGHGHRSMEPAFSDYNEYRRFYNLQQRIGGSRDDKDLINDVLENDANLPLAERVILYGRKEKMKEEKFLGKRDLGEKDCDGKF